jgi:hypothetical protein
MAKAKSPIAASASVLTAMLVLALVATGSCKERHGEWKTMEITKGSQACRVVIWSPPYGKNARPPDAVAVSWDGEQIFKGVLPTNTSGATGMPVELLEIRCAPGDHVLEIKSGSASQKQKVSPKDHETCHYRVFGVKDGQEILIEDLGNNPMFL